MVAEIDESKSLMCWFLNWTANPDQAFRNIELQNNPPIPSQYPDNIGIFSGACPGFIQE